MIDSIADLELETELKDIDPDSPEFYQKIDDKLKEKLNLGLDEIKKPIADYILNNAETLTLDLPNIVPYGDYSKLIEDNDDMATFLKKEAIKLENWILESIYSHDVHKALLVFDFICPAIDDEKYVHGKVFVSKAGIIRHAFVTIRE